MREMKKLLKIRPSKTGKMRLPTCILSLFVIVILTDQALAQSPLGIGVAEQRIDPSSPFAFIFLQIQAWQQNFARIIQHALITMRSSGEGALWLIGLSLVYGILHAAGPGHGKAVISSYLIADEASLKRGVILSFFSSLLQAVSAIAIVFFIFFLWPAKLTITANFIVNLSFALVMCLGGWMLIGRIRALWRRKKQTLHAIFDDVNSRAAAIMEPATFTPSAAVGAEGALASSPFISSPITEPMANRPHLAYRSAENQPEQRGFKQLCADCGQFHLIAERVLHDKLSWKTVLPLIAATGLRPCAGAITVMSFAMLNDLLFIGTLSVFAMSLGTFITVSALACLAVYAKRMALAATAQKKARHSLLKEVMEWGACLFIFITGALLFFSSMF